MSRCRSCDAEIVWGRTRSGKAIPLDAKPEKRAVAVGLGTGVRPDAEGAKVFIVDTYVPHFATCPDAESFRKTAGSQRDETEEKAPF